MQKAISRLTALGFSDYEARAYTTLLKDSPLSAYEIAKFSGIPSSKIYEVVRRLENKNTIQSIRGARASLFLPVPPEEFIRTYRFTVEQNLSDIRRELKGVKVGIDTTYTWHIMTREDLLLRAKRMASTAGKSLLVMAWPEEFDLIRNTLETAKDREVKVSVVYYGSTTAGVGTMFHHTPDDTMHSSRGMRGLTIVADSREAMIATVRDKRINAIWSMNEAFVLMAEDYIRHDIFLIKTMRRFAPQMQKRFGERFEKMLDLFSDENL